MSQRPPSLQAPLIGVIESLEQTEPAQAAGTPEPRTTCERNPDIAPFAKTPKKTPLVSTPGRHLDV
jgi:hypothetical protein